tara:strand:+ start:622 stop:960 length:339 start_codon:yes stop_codon:yes gene_type:complete
MSTQSTLLIDWYCKQTLSQASRNTFCCLLGCYIGDFVIIDYFQFMEIDWPVSLIMTLAIINSIITTIILSKQMLFKLAFKTAICISLVSMISMEAVMNLPDYILTRGTILYW